MKIDTTQRVAIDFVIGKTPIRLISSETKLTPPPDA